MRLNRFGLWVIVLSALLLGACRTAAIHNVQDAEVATNQGQPTLSQVENAIVRAGAGLGWQMEKQESGHIVGTLNVRDHRAEVDITYDRNTYDITYRDSRNLNYDGQNIHQNYNGWISNLDDQIRTQLLTL